MLHYKSGKETWYEATEFNYPVSFDPKSLVSSQLQYVSIDIGQHVPESKQNIASTAICIPIDMPACAQIKTEPRRC